MPIARVSRAVGSRAAHDAAGSRALAPRPGPHPWVRGLPINRLWSGAVPARPFTPAEANSALADVRPVAERLVEVRARMRELEHDQGALLGAIAGNGGGYSGADLAAARGELEALARVAVACAERLDELGVLLKDPDTGLLDFVSERDGEIVLLCWHVGERSVAFWHSPQDGFAGRKPVDWGE